MKKWKGLACTAILGTAILSATSLTTAFATTSTDADTAMNAFVNAFWDSSVNYFYTNSDHQVHSAHAYGPDGGLYSDFWWEAQLWEAVMDAYQRTNSSTYLTMIDNVYNGFINQYPTMTDNYNDDMGWWALACSRAYQITNESKYLTQAENLFSSIYGYSDSTYGGGIWWTRDGSNQQKNIATNAPAVMTAVNLYKATNNSTYLSDAESLFSWLTNTLQSGGHVYDHISGSGSGTVSKWDFSYNFGTYIGAADALYSATNDSTYLNDAISAANWVTSNLTNGGTAMYEGVNDAGGFKMILVRNLNQLATTYKQSKFIPYLQANADESWSNRRTSDNLVGPDWSAPVPSTYLQSMTAASGADILQIVSPDNTDGLQPEDGNYEAENGIVTNVGTESTYTGYTGRGYVAGWDASGESVTFNVNVPAAGTDELSFHYAAGAGNATREVDVNGSSVNSNVSFPGTGSWSSWNTVTLNGASVVANQSFSSTGSWSSWNEVTVPDVYLNSGSNTVSVIYNSSNGSTNYLNLDEMLLQYANPQ